MSVTMLVATYLVCMSKVRWHTVSYKDVHCVDFTENVLFGRYSIQFAYHDDRRLGSFLTKNTPMILDTIRNGTVYEPLDRSDDYLN